MRLANSVTVPWYHVQPQWSPRIPLEDASDVTVREKSHRGLHCGLKDLVLNPPLKIEKLAIPADIQAERARDCAHAMICIKTRMISRSVGSPVMGVTEAGKPAMMVALSFSTAVDMISCGLMAR